MPTYRFHVTRRRVLEQWAAIDMVGTSFINARRALYARGADLAWADWTTTDEEVEPPTIDRTEMPNGHDFPSKQYTS